MKYLLMQIAILSAFVGVLALIGLHAYAIYHACGWMGFFVHCVIAR